MNTRHWLLDEDTHELLKLYKAMMVKAYEDIRMENGHYHPTFEHNSISMYELRDGYIYAAYNSTAQFILKELLRRWEDEPKSYAQEVWWNMISQRTFVTNISIARERRHPGETEVVEVVIPHKAPETLVYEQELFTLVGAGLKRKVFLSPCGTYVLKVPMSQLGVEENELEHHRYHNEYKPYYGKCELLANGYLRMEYIKPAFLTTSDEYPEWVTTIAEAQVGYNLEGVLKAYDYGSDI